MIISINEYKNNILIHESIKLKPIDKNDTYHMFSINYDNIKCGEIEYYFDNKELEIISIIIDKEYQNKSIGSNVIKLLVKKYKPVTLIADCLSQQSFYSFVKAIGKPSMFGNVFKVFTSYDEVNSYLPKTTELDNDGHLIGSGDSGVFIRYEFKINESNNIKYDNLVKELSKYKIYTTILMNDIVLYDISKWNSDDSILLTCPKICVIDTNGVITYHISLIERLKLDKNIKNIIKDLKNIYK